MQTKYFFIAFLCCTICCTENVNAQITGGIHSSGKSFNLAIGYNFSERIWADMRFYVPSLSDEFDPEIMCNYNIIKRDKFEHYTGFGFFPYEFNSVEAIYGMAVMPFEKNKNISFNLEFKPLFDFDDIDLLITGSVGVRYILR
ncbi:MAG TPA: hypothetical protein PK047_12450 [Saprospiraceae bacterium]|jgi:hypothetical protein|nr:hypothetical protein [Saprospiraceae bacterium]HRO09667.1 hypothetical protein [Saprospiraceae bacterium]HRP42955.1 hypothetical protein [Saprospiraceae bacterium]